MDRMSILHVDDCDGEALLVRQIAFSAGLPWSITRARNGLEGLTLATSRRFDGVITDCRMPIMDGLELLRALRATAIFSAPVVMMTSGLSSREKKEVCEMGAEIIYKGIDLRDIKMNLQCIHASFSRRCIAYC